MDIFQTKFLLQKAFINPPGAVWSLWWMDVWWMDALFWAFLN